MLEVGPSLSCWAWRWSRSDLRCWRCSECFGDEKSARCFGIEEGALSALASTLAHDSVIERAMSPKANCSPTVGKEAYGDGGAL